MKNRKHIFGMGRVAMLLLVAELAVFGMSGGAMAQTDSDSADLASDSADTAFTINFKGWEPGGQTDLNSGLARIGTHSSGTNVYVTWDDEGMPPAPTGFVVARSSESSTTGFSQISPVLVPGTTGYCDSNLDPGTYYYVVVIVTSSCSWYQWTDVSGPNVIE